MSNNEFDKLRDSFERLSINDSSIEYEYENNKAMGFGFRCGFLGMLHMDIVKERLEREHNIQTIFTIPNVVSIVRMKNFKHEAVKSGTNVDDLIATGLRKYVIEHVEKASSYQLPVTSDNKDQQEAGSWKLEAGSPVEIKSKYNEILKEWLIVRS